MDFIFDKFVGGPAHGKLIPLYCLDYGDREFVSYVPVKTLSQASCWTDVDEPIRDLEITELRYYKEQIAFRNHKEDVRVSFFILALTPRKKIYDEIQCVYSWYRGRASFIDCVNAVLGKLRPNGVNYCFTGKVCRKTIRMVHELNARMLCGQLDTNYEQMHEKSFHNMFQHLRGLAYHYNDSAIWFDLWYHIVPKQKAIVREQLKIQHLF